MIKLNKIYMMLIGQLFNIELEKEPPSTTIVTELLTQLKDIHFLICKPSIKNEL